MECGVRNVESRLRDKDATTENGQELPEAFAVNRDGLPEKLFTLRQKLYLKEPLHKFRSSRVVTMALVVGDL